MVHTTDRREQAGIIRRRVNALRIKRRCKDYSIVTRAAKCENPAYWRKVLEVARSEDEKR